MARALEELLTPRAFDLTTFPDNEGYQQLVIERGIQFRSLCEHYFLPFAGHAYVAYLPGEVSRTPGLVSAGGWGPAGPAPSSAGPAPHHQAPAVHLAAFSVVAGPDGATTLTLYPGEVANPNLVRQALADHGIPALVTADKFCRTADQPSPGVGQVVVLPYRPQQRISGPGPTRTGGPGPVVIYGSGIPSGVELSIGYRQDPQEFEISFSLIQAGAPLTCTSIPDNGPHGND